MRAIDKFINHFGGNQSKAAAALGKKQGNVSYWLKPGKDLPLQYTPTAAKIMGVKPKDLRPDHYK